MKHIKYIKRLIDKDLDLRAKAFGAIQIIGPKGCGKTRTAGERCKSIIQFQNEDYRDSYLLTATTKPSFFFNLPTPILFDEWQDAPKIWGAIRQECDDNLHFGDYYLTGSSSKRVNTPHTGTMRISTVEMYPMSLFESKESNGKISLKDLFDKKVDIDGIKSDLTYEQLIYACSRGGWPKTFEIDDANAKLLVAKDYYKQIINKDISSLDFIKRNSIITDAILKSYARNIGTLCKKNVIYEDIKSSCDISMVTFDDYVDQLKELYVIKDYDAWCPQIRSKKAMRSPKKHMFIDPSLALAALKVSKNYFIHDFDLFGHVFESLVYRDLTIYSQSLDGYISHYHDVYDLEVDAVLHLGDGRYALIEIKVGYNYIDKAIKNLKKVQHLIKEHNKKKDSVKIKEPDLLIIITATGIALEKDGVKIIPIGCLKD